jgi:hypothetical protein
MITRIILSCAYFDIFDVSIPASAIRFLIFDFFFSLFLCIKKRRVGSLLCFISFVCPHICHEDWSASRHVEDMNLDMECPTLRFRFFVAPDGKEEKQNLPIRLDWVQRFAFVSLPFLQGISFWYWIPDWSVLFIRELEDMSMRRCYLPPCICDARLKHAFLVIFGHLRCDQRAER